MSYKSDFDVFVGGTSGVFKGVKVESGTCIQKNIQNLVCITDHDYVTTMSWGDEEEKEILLGCGKKDIRSIKIYDTECASFTCSFFCNEGKGSIVGISRFNDAILTAVESGDIKLWRFAKNNQIQINAGENLRKMRHSRIQKNIIATGGMENPLQLFDLERERRIFVEKNLPHDSLQLRVPLWISDIDFLTDTQTIATASRYGHVRLYDTSVQRRPVINIEIKDEALTTLAVTPREKQIIVGSGRGRMNLIDLRNPAKILNTYKGSVGAITSIACSWKKPYIVSVGLDRYLRVHHMDTKKLEKDVYMKSRLSCLLLRSEFTFGEKTEGDAESLNLHDNSMNGEDSESVDNAHSKEVNDAEYDALFDNMQVVGYKEKGDSPRKEMKSRENGKVSINSVKKRKKNTKLNKKRVKQNEDNEQ